MVLRNPVCWISSWERECIVEMQSEFDVGDGAPQDKIDRHVATCKATTSGSLGLRICGMRVVTLDMAYRQLYCPLTDSWIYQEKAWGKSLRADDMVDAIALFFFDGIRLRTDLMDDILAKLCEIRDEVQNVGTEVFTVIIVYMEVLVIESTICL